jgi:citrate lyase subunit beta/citryl-CoA lyase
MDLKIETVAKEAGVAGHCGPGVRSDVLVRIEPRASGGIVLDLESRVKPYYGDSIRSQAEQVLEALGVRHAQVTIRDEGALPFVIAARMEAAARRIGIGHGTRVLPTGLPLPPPSARSRMRISRLYLPGSEPRYLVNAALHGAHGIILDLEDSVHVGEKDEARLLVRNALRAVNLPSCERMVRINPLPLGFEDLEEIIPESPDLILIPKVENPEQVQAVSRKIAEVKGNFGVSRTIWLMPILESALGIEHAFAIATASDEVAAITIGLEDYTADLGVVKTASGAESLFARQRLVNAARAAGIQAIDSVFADVGDPDGLRAWALHSRALGFEGMGCVHPSQIAVVHQAFAPTAAEIEEARQIVAAYDAVQVEGRGVVSLGAKMIDAPVVRRARRALERALAMGLLG